MKIFLNKCYGGYGLSKEAITLYNNRTNSNYVDYWDIEKSFKNEMKFRTDPILVSIVEELGLDAGGEYSELQVIEIPDDAKEPYIHEYDGFETLREGRVW